MKKFLFIIPLSILLSGFFIIPSYASTLNDYINDSSYNSIIVGHYGEDHWRIMYFWNSGRTFEIQSDRTINDSVWGAASISYNDCYFNPFLEPDRELLSGFQGDSPMGPFGTIVYVRGNLIDNYDLTIDINDYNPNPDPDEPEPGSSWLVDLWEWVLWQLGLNDDYSGDIDAYITGGDREPFELVTPSPTPSPTPIPSPTPYTLDIIDNNGNPVYTITGIPGNTYNITNTTNNNDGSAFDIFEVDLKIGDGGSVNPRDGLNNVMSSSEDFLSDVENVNMQPVGDSFSIIPNDWFLILGVVACFPFIAGFISKLLK